MDPGINVSPLVVKGDLMSTPVPTINMELILIRTHMMTYRTRNWSPCSSPLEFTRLGMDTADMVDQVGEVTTDSLTDRRVTSLLVSSHGKSASPCLSPIPP